jgi:hypothetical protein
MVPPETPGITSAIPIAKPLSISPVLDIFEFMTQS